MKSFVLTIEVGSNRRKPMPPPVRVIPDKRKAKLEKIRARELD